MRLERRVRLVRGAVDQVMIEVQLDADLALVRGRRVIDLDLELVLRGRDAAEHANDNQRAHQIST